MGHLPNKFRKERQDALIEERRRQEVKPPRPLPRCLCGLTWLEVPIMWVVSGDRWAPPKFYCPACLPAEHLPIVMDDVARLPSEE
jgi:hypothetical protein